MVTVGQLVDKLKAFDPDLKVCLLGDMGDFRWPSPVLHEQEKGKPVVVLQSMLDSF